MLSVILFLPLAIGLAGFLVPSRLVGWLAFAGSLVSLGLAIALVADFDTALGTLQEGVNDSWIPDLGVRYILGVDGLSLFLVLLTSLLWSAATLYSALQVPDRARNYFFMLGLAQSATLGAFLAQDLLLFVLCFDLMLIPFYFLIGAWGTGDRVRATIKMIVFTFSGSLLMLAAAIATAVLSSDAAGGLTFSLEALRQVPLGTGSQYWIFCFFAFAFLVKMPAFLAHGWMPDAYRSCPLPVLVLLSGVLAKVGAYGFLRVALPLFPDAAVHFQTLLLIIALGSIVYGSAMAFTQTNLRLIAGYSSMAQMGFITLGIFSLATDGADGSVIQMVNHGLVVAPVFFIIALLAERTGTEDIREMGGMAKRAPVLAIAFVIVTMALLAIPGSANFVGEFYILSGVFHSQVAIALIASSGIAFAAFYALRLYQRTMHNRLPEGTLSRDLTLRESVVLVPLVLAIVGLALYPALITKRGEASVDRSLSSLCEGTYSAGSGDTAIAGCPAAVNIQAGSSFHRGWTGYAPLAEVDKSIETPDIDYAALSPLIALTAGICVVLLAGLVSPRGNRWLSSALTLIALGATAGLLIWRLGEGDVDLVAGALRVDGLALTIGLMTVLAAGFAVLLQLRDPGAEEAGHSETHGLMLGSVLGMVMLAQAQNLITFFIALELLSIPLYVLCGSHRTRPGSLESGLKYLIVGSLGSATLLYGMAFIYGGSGSTDFTAIATGIGGDLADDPLVLIGIALCAVGLAFKVSVAPFHQWTPDVYEGAPTPVTAFMAVATKAAAFAVFARFFIVALGPSADQWQPALAALAAISIVVGNVGALGQDSLKRLLGYSGVAQGGYILVGLLVATEDGVNAMVFYLAAYTLMNLAAFGVIAIRERETPLGDDISAVEGLGRDRPALAWPLTISMLALAGIPGTAGFMGKLYLIEAAVGGDYTWLGVLIVIGSMISLAYYLRVIAAVWMRPAPRLQPAIAGGSPEAGGVARTTPVGPGRTPAGRPSGGRCALVVGGIVLAAAATVVFGVAPTPLVHFAENAGASIAAVLG